MGKRELVDLLNLSSWCLVMVERLFLAVPWECLPFVIVVFPDHTHLLFLTVSILDLCTLTYFDRLLSSQPIECVSETESEVNEAFKSPDKFLWINSYLVANTLVHTISLHNHIGNKSFYVLQIISYII